MTYERQNLFNAIVTCMENAHGNAFDRSRAAEEFMERLEIWIDHRIAESKKVAPIKYKHEFRLLPLPPTCYSCSRCGFATETPDVYKEEDCEVEQDDDDE